MILAGNELNNLISQGVIKNSHQKFVNAASIDIRLGKTLMVEWDSRHSVEPWKGGKGVEWKKVYMETLPYGCYSMAPNEFVLGSSIEMFFLPNNLSAEYKTKSTMARNGLDHALAGWCDAGWNSSVLTLELKNQTQNHYITLKPGMKIGQMIFHRHEDAGYFSYSTKGSYNGDATVQAGK